MGRTMEELEKFTRFCRLVPGDLISKSKWTADASEKCSKCATFERLSVIGRTALISDGPKSTIHVLMMDDCVVSKCGLHLNLTTHTIPIENLNSTV